MADELTDTSTRAFCRGTKPFDISFFIRSGMYRKEVMKMCGEPRSCGCGGDITLRLTKHTLGIIEQATDCTIPYFYVNDWEGKEILHIVGPTSRSCFNFSLDKGGEFDILLPDDRTLIGKIAKYWGGKDKEIGSKIGDIWGVKFPLDMEVGHKALLLAACFLLNFQYQDVLDEP
ncbi:Phospholipid scramblase 2 [Orchesella cincta]|uniref:Phospholipid scramblase n=1 Tax=Orchesella cincta TaxID=48709 RepID=A0A1D2MNJ9_ORCCI|nr:Phospholipid scramblase 2 [Orchesella cincta]